jgi:amidohydrolase
MIKADSIKELATKLAPELLAVRRHLHQNPELSFKEYNTSLYIQNKLKEAGIPFTAGHAGTGIIALIEGKDPSSKTILLRADMDALPIDEKNNVPYCSVTKGVMHACGHDVHSTCVLGAAKILKELRKEFTGTVKVIFQPGEEVLPGGASLMIKEGVLQSPPVNKALALHVFPNMETGKVGFRKGMYMASTDELYLTVNGKGGHAAMVSEYVNPLIIASEILLTVQVNFMNENALKGSKGENIPTVVAFGKIEGKGATNVIPDKVEAEGTFRTMNEDWRNEAHQRLRDIVSEVSARYGIESLLRIEKGYPYLVNDVPFTEQCRAAASEYLGKDQVEDLPLRMTAEDFAFISQQVPSCFFRLGTGNKKKGITSGVHTPTFDIDESALETGTGLLAWIILNELK